MKTSSEEDGAEHVLPMFNRPCGLVDARISASEKDLPVKSPIPLSTEAIAANVAAESRVSVKGAKNKTLAGLMQKNKADL